MYSVLFVDDEPIIRDLIALFLPRYGNFIIDLAEDPETGMRMHQKNKYDAIISDFDMPDTDGILFLINLRSSGDKTPFILFTGKGREEIAIEALNWGADYYLHKSGDTSQFRELAHVLTHAIQRKQSIDEVQRSRQLMKNIINHLPDPTFAINTDGVLVAWNKAMEKLTQVKAETILGKGKSVYSVSLFGEKKPLLLDYLLNPELEISGTYQKIVRNHNEITGTYSINISGKERIFWIKASLFRDSDGNVTGAIESLRDATQRVKLLRSMRDSRKNLENIINHIPDATFVLDNSGTIIAWNQAMEKLSGISQSAALGKCDAIHSRSLFGVPHKTLADHLLAGSNPTTNDYEMLECSHNVITALADRTFYLQDPGSYLSTASILYNTDGDTFGVIESIRDVTKIRDLEKDLQKQQEALTSSYEELELAQEELRESYQTLAEWQRDLEESELKYRTLVENSNDGVFIIQDCQILYINPICSLITGYGEGDMYQMGLWEIILPEDRERMIQAVTTAISEKKHSFRYTSRIISRTGEIKTIEFAFGIVDYKGRDALLGRGRDVTEKVRIEEALARANKKLQLMSGITRHDIKNHLTSLLGACSLLRDADLSDDNRNLILIALNAAKSIDRDISFTSLYQDIGSASPVWISVSKEFFLLESFITSLNISFSCQIPTNIEIYVDSLFPKVCYNLIENAIRHGNVSHIHLNSDEKEGHLLIFIADDGTGVPEDQKEKIFLRGHGRNTGMGLFLTRNILDITGITIRETGTEGKGAVFLIMVPPGGFRYIG